MINASAQQVFYFQPVTVVPVANPMTPLPILDHFARSYPGVTPYWGIEGKNYVVRYIDPSTSLGHLMIYDRHGVILRREDEVHMEDCPAGLQAYYFKNFPDESLRVWSYERGDEIKYYIRHRSRTVWFDKEGNYIGRKLLGIF